MANEAQLRTRLSTPVNFDCVDGLGMEKGTIVCLSGPREVKATSADNDIAIGITTREKIASDGRTTVPVDLYGIYDCYVDAAVPAITLGAQVTISAANTVKLYTTLDDEKGYVLGRALEAWAADGTRIQVLVGGQ